MLLIFFCLFLLKLKTMQKQNPSCKLFLTALVIFFFIIQGKAQSSANTAGGDATGAGGSVAYSVGQPFYITYTGANGTVAQGVQQTYQIFSLGINQSELNISLAVFPNPTYDNLNIEIKDFNNE